MIEYTKHYYGKHGTRMNPNYPPHHVFTVCRCEKCGEDYEADRKHICKQQNSYPVESENNYIKGEKHECKVN